MKPKRPFIKKGTLSRETKKVSADVPLDTQYDRDKEKFARLTVSQKKRLLDFLEALAKEVDKLKQDEKEEQDNVTYLVRPDDFMVFSLNKDNQTYSLMDAKIRWPNHHHHEYSKAALINVGFFVGTEAELPAYREKQKKYYETLRNSGE